MENQPHWPVLHSRFPVPSFPLPCRVEPFGKSFPNRSKLCRQETNGCLRLTDFLRDSVRRRRRAGRYVAIAEHDDQAERDRRDSADVHVRCEGSESDVHLLEPTVPGPAGSPVQPAAHAHASPARMRQSNGVEVVEHAIVTDAEAPAEAVLVEPFGFGVAEGVTGERFERGADGVAVVAGSVELPLHGVREAYRPGRGRVRTRRR